MTKNNILKGAIIASGMTRDELAIKSGVSKPTIQTAVNGGQTTIQSCNAICKALDKTIDEIFGGVE